MFNIFKEWEILKKTSEPILNKTTNDVSFIQIFLDHIMNITQIDIYNNLRSIPIEILRELNTIHNTNISNIEYLYPIGISHDRPCVTYEYTPPNNVKNILKIQNLYLNYYEFNINNSDRNKKYLLNPSTYCEWFAYSIDPNNFLRSFKMTIDNKQINININEFLNDITYKDDIFNKIESLFSKKSCLILKQSPNNINFYNSVMFTTSHPVEYSCWTLLNILNAYFLGHYFNCSLVSISQGYQKGYEANRAILDIYRIIIHKEFEIPRDYELDYDIDTSINKYFNLLQSCINSKISKSPDILSKKYGCPISINILLSAMSQGSLFVRKCFNTSLIDTFSDVLKKNVYNNPSMKDSTNIKLYKCTPQSANDHEIYNLNANWMI